VSTLKSTPEPLEEAIRLSAEAKKPPSHRFWKVPLVAESPRDTLCPSLSRSSLQSLWSAKSGETLPSHEGQGRWEAPERKRRIAVSCSQLLRRVPEGRDEPGIGFPELVAHLGAPGVEQRSGRFLRALRMIVGMLTPDGRGPQWLASCSGPPDSRLFFDLMNQVESSLFPSLLREVLPTG